jgi:hypothetical protein
MVRAGPDDERMWQRIHREMIERFTESRLLTKFLEGFGGGNQRYLFHVGTLSNDVRQSTRCLDRSVAIKIDRKVECVVP